jgi:hydrogenase maturation protein HypF
MDQPPSACVRRAIRIGGTVQGVGFRPYVHHLARTLGVAGWVCNDGAGVSIEAEGDPARVARLIEALPRQAPPLASVRSLAVHALEPLGERAFVIKSSRLSAPSTAVPADAASCAACLAELLDPSDRRYRYPFINCVHCGPRFTLTRALPYDRARTTMAGFPLCPACRQEYEDPDSRRFHAEPNACPACGPRLWLVDGDGRPPSGQPDRGEPIQQAWQWIEQGRVVAMRGIGGFHLVCDARQAAAVVRLRRRKQRDEKPFAMMVLNPSSAARWVSLQTDQTRLLESTARPIVLADRRPGAADLGALAPGLDRLGLMLPYTPLHYLLFHAALGAPPGTAWLQQDCPVALVMTSANPHGEPLVRDNEEALQRLAGIADAFVLHDRPIAVRCDDSVVRAADTGRQGSGKASTPEAAVQPVFVRRARGYTPEPIGLSRSGAPVLALGGHYKNTICMARGAEAFVSQHLGDTDNASTRLLVDEAIAHWQAILALRPVAVACDLHPDYASSALAARIAQEQSIRLIPVQHHHAHIAAVLAEHRYDGPVLGVALDGTGYGCDGTAWGGELLRVDGAASQRISHLVQLPLPGGEAAAREPWRMGAAVLYRLGRATQIAVRYGAFPAARQLAAVLDRGLQSPPTSSMGRWFDAAAGLLGTCAVNSYEGQAAMQLEALAQRHDGHLGRGSDGTGLASINGQGELDLLPLLASLADEADAARGAARFHRGVVAGLDAWVSRHAGRIGLDTVALGGGCFMNAIIVRELTRRLEARGLRVLAARQVPANDGGLSLGQAWVAQRVLAAPEAHCIGMNVAAEIAGVGSI